MKRLTDDEIKAALAAVPEWSEVGEAIQRTYQFPDFVTAMRFVNRVAQAAEAGQHHPDILIRYNKVTLTLATHDAGGITEKDFDLAAKTDGFLPTDQAGGGAGGGTGVGPGTAGGGGKVEPKTAAGAKPKREMKG